MICIDRNLLRIQIFEKIVSLSDKKIVLIVDGRLLIIQGISMVVNFLEKDEMIVCGSFTHLYWEDKVEKC